MGSTVDMVIDGQYSRYGCGWAVDMAVDITMQCSADGKSFEKFLGKLEINKTPTVFDMDGKFLDKNLKNWFVFFIGVRSWRRSKLILCFIFLLKIFKIFETFFKFQKIF